MADQEQMVLVSLLGKHSYRQGKGQPTIHYKPGIQAMPIGHARTMQLTHRIVQVAEAEGDEAPVVQRVPFDGRFDEKLTTTLVNAGYATLADVARASQSDLMGIDGIGPAAYEKIQAAVHG